MASNPGRNERFALLATADTAGGASDAWLK